MRVELGRQRVLNERRRDRMHRVSCGGKNGCEAVVKMVSRVEGGKSADELAPEC